MFARVTQALRKKVLPTPSAKEVMAAYAVSLFTTTAACCNELGRSKTPAQEIPPEVFLGPFNN